MGQIVKELQAIGVEIDQILKQVVYLANTKEQGRYIFGGDSAKIRHLQKMVHTKVEKMM